MSKNSIAYRTYGSAALKPEYLNNEEHQASIIDFNQVKPRKTARRVQVKTTAFDSKVVKAFEKNAQLGSLQDAFVDQRKISSEDRRIFACTFASFFVLSVVLVIIGA